MSKLEQVALLFVDEDRARDVEKVCEAEAHGSEFTYVERRGCAVCVHCPPEEVDSWEDFMPNPEFGVCRPIYTWVPANVLEAAERLEKNMYPGSAGAMRQCDKDVELLTWYVRELDGGVA